MLFQFMLLMGVNPRSLTSKYTKDIWLFYPPQKLFSSLELIYSACEGLQRLVLRSFRISLLNCFPANLTPLHLRSLTIFERSRHPLSPGRYTYMYSYYRGRRHDNVFHPRAPLMAKVLVIFEGYSSRLVVWLALFNRDVG